MTLYKDVGLWHWVGIDYYAIFEPEALFFCILAQYGFGKMLTKWGC